MRRGATVNLTSKSPKYRMAAAIPLSGLPAMKRLFPWTVGRLKDLEEFASWLVVMRSFCVKCEEPILDDEVGT